MHAHTNDLFFDYVMRMSREKQRLILNINI